MIATLVPDVSVALADGAVQVVAARLDVAPAIVDELERCLSGTERQRARRFVVERDRRRFIVRRGRLRHLLASRLGVAPGDIELECGPAGKPELSRLMADGNLRFNVSHSGEAVAYALARGREIGIDIEAVRDLPEADDIAARFFSQRENEAYLALRPEDKPLGFFTCWTRKEAFVKALGDGLDHPLDRFEVSLAPGEAARILRVVSTSGEACGWTLQAFAPGPGLVGAVVVQEPSPT